MSTSTRWFLAMVFAATSVGCASAPLAAVVKSVPDAEPVAADARRIVLDASNTSIEVDVQAMTSHTLHFHGAGALVVSLAHPKASSLDLTIDTTTAEAALGVVADVAKSDDFLAVGSYPTAHLVSRAVTIDAAGRAHLYCDLELHGTTRTLEVPLDLHVTADNAEFSTAFSLNRHDYHVDSTGSIDGVVGDSVVVRIAIHDKLAVPAPTPTGV